MKLVNYIGLIITAFSIIFLSGCKNGENSTQAEVSRPIVINIQPLDNINDYSSAIKDFEQKYLKEIGIENYTIHISPNRMSPKSTLNDAGTRQSAAKLVKLLDGITKPGEFTIGITQKDISTAIHNSQDYGILGLSYLGRQKRACITSTYRLKSKNDLWKLIAHEFTHAYFGQNHCSVDNDKCIMQDAKGGNPHFEQKEFLCETCASQIASKISTNQYGIPTSPK